MKGCFVAGRIPGRECYGRLTEHHIIPRQRIKRFWRTLNIAYRTGTKPKPWPLRKCLDDPRNKATACWGCHVNLTETGNSRAQVREGDLPKNFWHFVEEHNLWSELPRHLMALAPDAPSEAA